MDWRNRYKGQYGAAVSQMKIFKLYFVLYLGALILRQTVKREYGPR